MADAKLTPRQLAEVLQRLDEIERQSHGIRHHVIQAMAQRRRGQAARRKGRARELKR